jgi:hypothetical protein
VIHDHREPVWVGDAGGVFPERRELQVDEHRHVHVANDHVAGMSLVETGSAGEDLLDDRHAHGASCS